MDTDTPAPDDTTEPELHNPPTTTAADHTDPPDTEAELARWKQLARKHEDRAKANADAAKELERIKAASMTELERAIAETKSQTRAEVMREVGATRVGDQVRLAAAGRPIDVDALLEGMNPERFMDDDGQPDVKAIGKWVDQIAPNKEPAAPGVPRVPFGVRDTGKATKSPEQDFADFLTARLKADQSP